MPEPHLFEFLSRPEFKMCFALAWVSDAADYRGVYPLDSDNYRTPGSPPGKAEFWEESIRRAIRYLAFEHGYVFEAVRPHRDGRIDGKEPITPENKLYRIQLADGGLPHILSALEEAVVLLEQRCPGFEVEPLLAAAADVRATLGSVRINPEEETLRERLRRSAFASLGLTAGEEMGH